MHVAEPEPSEPDADGVQPALPVAPRWLDADEKAAWTGFVALMLLLPGRLEAPLQQAHGLALFEYLVLSALSEAPERRLRMSELAGLANGSRSRLSNVVKRLEQRGLLWRAPDPADGRYTAAGLTDSGCDLVARAAPVHLESVRRLVLDPLTGSDQAALTSIAGKLRLGPEELSG